MGCDMESTELTVRTGTRPAVVDITAEVTEFCRGRGDGLVSIFVPHATAGVAIMEAGAASDDDLLAAVGEILPPDDRWRHRHGSPGHGADHLLPAIIAPSITVPVLGSRPALGTWQSIVLVDTNRDNPERRVLLSFLAG
jgi:secondary thiamine-phosphate synthase enzyme